MTSQEIKNLINSQITNQTQIGQTTHLNVGGRMTDIVDYVDQEIANIPEPIIPTLTVGEVIGEATNTVIFQYGINQYYADQPNYKAILPSDKVAGESIYVYVYNNSIIRGAVDNISNIYTTATGSTGSINVLANQLYKFTKVEGVNWIYEIIYGKVPDYKVYSAFLTFGSETVTAIVLQNTIGNLLWGYNGSDIIATVVEAPFTNNKTVIIPGLYRGNGINYTLTGFRQNATTVVLESYKMDDNTQGLAFTDGVFVEIRIYT